MLKCGMWSKKQLLTVEMTTLSLLVGKCGSGRREDHGFEFGSRTLFGQEFLANDSVKTLYRSLNCVWLRDLGGSRNGHKMRILAKVRKGKKHDYPWPDDIDPHSSTGALTYLSSFKPLSEKPKPVTLAFEKPLVDLEKKIIEVTFFFHCYSQINLNMHATYCATRK